MTLFLMEVGRKEAKEAELLRVCNETRDCECPSHTLFHSPSEGECCIIYLHVRTQTHFPTLHLKAYRSFLAENCFPEPGRSQNFGAIKIHSISFTCSVVLSKKVYAVYSVWLTCLKHGKKLYKQILLRKSMGFKRLDYTNLWKRTVISVNSYT